VNFTPVGLKNDPTCQANKFMRVINYNYPHFHMIEYHQLVPALCVPLYRFRILYFAQVLNCLLPVLQSLLFHLPMQNIDNGAFLALIDAAVVSELQQFSIDFLHRDFTWPIGSQQTLYLNISGLPKVRIEKKSVRFITDKYLQLKTGPYLKEDDLSIAIGNNNEIWLSGHQLYIEEISLFSELAYHLSRTLLRWFQYVRQLLA
jgi:hypothetical protein